MNLLTWILSLLIEWVHPLHPADPVLAPVRSTTPGTFQGPAIRPAPGAGAAASSETPAASAATSDSTKSADSAESGAAAQTTIATSAGARGQAALDLSQGGTGPSGLEHSSPRVPPVRFDDDLARDIARDIDWITGGESAVRDDGGCDDDRPDAENAAVDPASAVATPAASAVRPGNGLSSANPLWPLGDRLIQLLAPRRTPIGWANWAALILLPVALAWGAQMLLDGLGLIGDLIWLIASAAIVYFTVPLGRLWRRLDRLSLLASAGEVSAFRRATSRWNDDDSQPDAAAGKRGADLSPSPPLSPSSSSSQSSSSSPQAAGHAGTDSGSTTDSPASRALPVGASPTLASTTVGSPAGAPQPGTSNAGTGNAGTSNAGLAGSAANGQAMDRAAFVLPLVDAYRDVFAPLFWLVLIGPAGPLAYAMARLAADRRSGVARRALYWIDWLPLRLSSASFAFSGRFDDAMLGLRCALDATRFDRVDVRVDRDPTLVQEVTILPTAAGAMGIRLAGPVVSAQLARAAIEHDEPEAEPSAANFSVLRSLLGRTAMIWGGLWVLLTLVG